MCGRRWTVGFETTIVSTCTLVLNMLPWKTYQVLCHIKNWILLSSSLFQQNPSMSVGNWKDSSSDIESTTTARI